MGVLDDLGIAADHAQVTGHPEMDHQVLAPVEPAEDVLAPALHRPDAPAGEGGGEARGVRESENTRLTHPGADEAPPDELQAQIASNRLDLGKLRH